ncbi:hypothetical protein evm_004348 [Chilo suppressalis]|nr:hypothetical protein evm_004348 [Chilo suppressalis]
MSDGPGVASAEPGDASDAEALNDGPGVGTIDRECRVMNWERRRWSGSGDNGPGVVNWGEDELIMASRVWAAVRCQYVDQPASSVLRRAESGHIAESRKLQMSKKNALEPTQSTSGDGGGPNTASETTPLISKNFGRAAKSLSLQACRKELHSKSSLTKCVVIPFCLPAPHISSCRVGASPQAGVPPTTAPTSNIFKMQKSRHIKKSYVDVFNPGGSGSGTGPGSNAAPPPPAPALLSPAPPPASLLVPAPAPQHSPHQVPAHART